MRCTFESVDTLEWFNPVTENLCSIFFFKWAFPNFFFHSNSPGGLSMPICLFCFVCGANIIHEATLSDTPFLCQKVNSSKPHRLFDDFAVSVFALWLHVYLIHSLHMWNKSKFNPWADEVSYRYILVSRSHGLFKVFNFSVPWLHALWLIPFICGI